MVLQSIESAFTIGCLQGGVELLEVVTKCLPGQRCPARTIQSHNWSRATTRFLRHGS